MKHRFHYDAVLKDLFQRDCPTILAQWMRGRKVQSFLNPEFSVVEKRVADLLILLDDGSILHIDFQSSNHRGMAYRQGIYALMTAEKFRRPVEQTVLYMGRAKMRMPDHLDTGGVQVCYRLLDIREFDSESLMRTGNPADCALALLAKGGTGRLRGIVERANNFPEPERGRVLTQMALLSGLRGASEQLIMEFKSMGISVDIEENVFLRNAYDAGKAEGMAEGKAEGEAVGKASLLREQLETKFGSLPKWAKDRVSNASPKHMDLWARKILTATTLEGAIGKRPLTL